MEYESKLNIELTSQIFSTSLESKDAYNKRCNQLLLNKKLLDLTHLKTYTIDDHETFEIDDAISLDIKDGRRIVWIHISDPSTFIPINSQIDLEARKKSTSIYLSTTTQPMLPRDLVENNFSLKAGKKTATLSISIELDNEGNILNYNIQRGFISPRYNLTYDEANELIDYAPPEENDLSELSNLLNKRREWRKVNGAIFLEQPYGRLKVIEGKQIIQITEPSMSRKLVSESMILFGTIVAKYAKKMSIPIPFRSQHRTRNTNSLIRGSHHLAILNSSIKQNLPKATTSTKAGYHFSLGLDCYSQATSPLRRYTDLLVHRQVLGTLDKMSIYSEEEISDILTSLMISHKQSIDIMREDLLSSQRNWFLKNKEKIWQTFFLRRLSKTQGVTLLYFKELEMDLACHLNSLGEWNIGDKLEIIFNDIPDSSKILSFKLVK
ncbi:ribonuclease catalytic domain-containing protein [Prochlorococcus sp. MIT 1307]|uniref:ribonuclease catalytic domain-containing protein n=1 Tax=Prochlorococcus sp. MIT 1307 TaxID=3096219 RepID=UPI002A75501B|nr:ribonuclease catalytic domain-containing protein [Prochlorococcus sp. MIT 1307]